MPVSFLFWLLFPFTAPLFDEEYSVIIKDHNNALLGVYLNNREQWIFPPEERGSLPQKLKQAVITYEDQYFYRHPGINPVSLLRATLQNIRNKKIVSGASTITMQVARMRKAKKAYLR
ncbi:MAG: hypothetical protein HC906_17320 [Bacteroidales bacterium]|nr:hypothetical protein [Bacteroidales bacterium]